MPARLFDLLSAAVGRRLRAIALGAALKGLAFGLTALFAALALGFGALAAYAALSAAEGPVVAALIVAGLCAALALAAFVVLAWRVAPAPPTPAGAQANAQTNAPPDPLVEDLLAALAAQDQLARALTQSARVATPTRLVVLALSCGLAIGGQIGKRSAPKC
ncbi:hypothetical protein GGD83_004166 [Rhodoblastus sphagnicola]|nr:hypothetical protein [Rhodoblastus sphagnicola]MBB4200337.1 hypothetical protein [Rhodoblastus sphagnicola]